MASSGDSDFGDASNHSESFEVDSVNVQRIVRASLDISDEGAREEWLRSECGGDEQLLHRVRAILKAHREFDQNELNVTRTSLGSESSESYESTPSSRTSSVDRISISDRYRILSEIGEGGMGVVWAAEQIKPIRRRVAIKVVKPGMDTRHVLARFEAERQALALMDHPSIAKVFDGGMTDQGQPYFAMEYVKGIPLTAYCDKSRLSLRDRLGLFVQVCNAVQHAHQKGIIHRDLKPSNILVAMQDETPVPKVIDFGLAKAIFQPLTERTMFTLHGVMMGTPLYMSPEQAERDNLDVDTRTDVYSLGVILYELLTGTTPLERKRIHEAPYHDILRCIKDDEPPRPSTRIETGVSLPNVASRRNAEPKNLVRSIKGDLDWIAMKALEKDRSRRYPTANDLAADVLRYLNHEPVEACPPGVRYRLSKFARRNRGLIATGSAFALILLLGTTISVWQAVRATIASREATENERRARTAAEAETKERFRAETAEENAKRIARLESEARLRAEEQQRSERWERYRSNIASAASSHQLNNFELLRKTLDVAPDEYRHWEWHYFFHQLDTKMRTVPECSAISQKADFLVRRENSKSLVVESILPSGRSPTVLEHEYQVDATYLNPNETKLLTVCGQKSLHLWDLQTGKEVSRCQFDSVVSTAKGNPALDQWLIASNQSHRWWVWSPFINEAPKHVPEFGDPGATSSVHFGATGQRIFGGHNTPRIVEAETGKTIATLPGWNRGVSPDGLQCVVSENNSLSIYQMLNGEKLFEIPNVPEPHRDVTWHPEGNRFLVLLSFPQNEARLYDASSGTEIARLTGHTNQIWSAAYSPDGKRIVTTSLDLTARVWDGTTGALVSKLRGHRGRVMEAFFSPDGTRVVTVGDELAKRLWDVESGEFIAPLIITDSAMTICHQGDLVAFVSKFGWVVDSIIWNAKHIEQNGILRGHTGFVYDTVFRPDGKEVASASWDGTIRTWNLATSQISHTYKCDALRYFRAVEYSPDGRFIVGTDVTNGTARATMWNVDSEAIVAEWGFPGDTEDFRAIFDPRNGSILSGRTDGFLLRLEPGKPPTTLTSAAENAQGNRTRYSATISDVAFSPDHKRLAMSRHDGLVKILDATTYNELHTLREHSTFVTRVRFSADGKWLATASDDGTVRLWNGDTYELKSVLPHGAPVYGIAFSPDGMRLATGCADQLIRMWDVTRQSLVAELRGHQDYVHSVDFSPDGTRLVSGSGDGTVRIWDSLPIEVRLRSPETYLPPPSYRCFRLPKENSIQVDGKLDEPKWQAAPWTTNFVDIEGEWKPQPRYRTRAKMLWDDQYFYIAAELEEPHLQGTFTKHDSYIFHQDNDFEVFLDPDGDGHNYAEYEMNAKNTGWDLRLSKPYKDGGQADDAYEIPGLKSAVHLDGSLNDPTDVDRNWTIELAFPWSVLSKLIERRESTLGANGRPQPTAANDNQPELAPRDGDQWRVNFSRVEWRYDVEQGEYRKVANRREDNWVWAPQGTINMHRPETWGYVQFSSATVGTPDATLVESKPDIAGPGKHLLHLIQYAQVDFRARNKRWAATLAELGLENLRHSSLVATPVLEVVGDHYEARVEVKLSNGMTETWCIREDSKVWRK